jgi:hypothetical protein
MNKKPPTDLNPVLNPVPTQPAQLRSISSVLGLIPTLPGESLEQYQQSLSELIRELDARSVMQVYLAEKIHDCLWWCRRYEEQKRATIIAEMGAQAKAYFSNKVTVDQKQVRDMFMQDQHDPKVLEFLGTIGHTVASLRQAAFERKALCIANLDAQIALQTKILAALQASYEMAFSRKTHLERLNLQNDLLRRNLQAIDIKAQETRNDGQRQADRSQPS